MFCFTLCVVYVYDIVNPTLFFFSQVVHKPHEGGHTCALILELSVVKNTHSFSEGMKTYNNTTSGRKIHVKTRVFKLAHQQEYAYRIINTSSNKLQ
jgi:hypothetical protein